MQEAEACMRALQNHLPLVRHRTTLAGAWMPQYLCVKRSCKRESCATMWCDGLSLKSSMRRPPCVAGA